VDASTRWIEKQKNFHEGYCHFEDEVWDSSLVLLATHEALPAVREGVIRWLVQKRLNRLGAFDGDVWETCFAVMALLEASYNRDVLKKSIAWLCGLRNEGGIVVSPSYTSLVGLCILRYLTKFGMGEEQALVECNRKFLSTLLSLAPDEEYDQFPYTDEPWGNSVVLLYLTQAHLTGHVQLDNKFYERHLDYYTKYIQKLESESKPLCRTEDLSLSVQMLHAIALATASQYGEALRLSIVERAVSQEILSSLPRISFAFQRMFEVDLDGTTWVIRITKSTRRTITVIIAVIGLVSSVLGIWPFIKPWLNIK
jgi:hypothetical protein